MAGRTSRPTIQRDRPCRTCGRDEWKQKPSGAWYCAPCQLTRQRQATPGRRRRHLKNKYGITVAQYDRMYLEQGGCCAICGEPEGKDRLVVDHDHTTGKVRGLLCRTHNVGLGHFGDSTALLQAAINYLREYERS